MSEPKSKGGGLEEDGKLLRFCDHEGAGTLSITSEQLLERMLVAVRENPEQITGMTILYYRENEEGGYTLGYQNAHMPAPWCFMLAEWYKVKLRQDHWSDFEDEM